MGQLILIALATFVSEDLTCIATGALIASGMLGFLPGVLACVAGIFFGDLLLYFAGRLLGRPIVRWKPLRRILSEQKLDLASNWLAERGASVVILSRFTPGLRLPTYVAAGLLRTRVLDFLVLLPAGGGALDAVAGGRVSRARQEPAPSRLRGTGSPCGGSRQRAGYESVGRRDARFWDGSDDGLDGNSGRPGWHISRWRPTSCSSPSGTDH